MRRHRPIGSLKYPGPHFRLAVLPVAVAEVEAADGDCATNGTADGTEDGTADGDEATVVTTVDDGGGSVGMSDVFPLLAISASTIWTILSLVDDEYGSSSPGDCEDVLLLLTMAAAAVLDGGALVVDVVGVGGLDVLSVGSV